MNKILNINLGGFAFTIDDDAFEYLSSYLDSIRRRFSASEGRDEILSDIEMRLGELISAELGSRNIIMLPDVEAAIQIMGKPEEFGADPIDNQRSMGRKSGRVRTGRRLFRDEEDKVAGGVCSGLAAYFGMNDPVWMRLIFVLLTFASAGFWIPAYILMWILVAPARTAAERLAMRGEPVNVDNIAKEVEEGFERIGDKVNEFSNSKKKSGVAGHSASNALANILNAIGQVFAVFIKFFAKFGLLILVLMAAAVFISLFVGWLGSFWGLLVAAPYLNFFSPFSAAITYLGVTALFFLLAIPAIGLGLLFARYLFKINTPGWLGMTMGLVWVISLLIGLTLGGLTAKAFSHSQTVNKKVDLTGITSDTLRIEMYNGERGDIYENWVNDNGIRIENGNLEIREWPRIVVKPSKRNRFECVQEISARGASQYEAERNTEQIEPAATVTGNTLGISNFIRIPKGNKFRAQDIRIKIAIPIGKYVVFGEDVNRHTWGTEYANDEYYVSDYPNKVFLMTKDGLVCADCPSFGDSEYHGRNDFENFIFEGNFDAEIRKGDRFHFTTEGNIEVIPSGGKLTVTNNGQGSGKVYIEAPVFTDLYVNGSGNVIIRGFDEHHAGITSRGASTVKAYFDCDNLKLNMGGASTIELFGKGDDLSAVLNEGSILKAGTFRIRDADLRLNTGSSARVFAEDDLYIEKDLSSEIQNDGRADIRQQEN